MNKDFLDEIIKEKLNQQQYDFTAADWNSFESRNTGSGTGSSVWKWLLGGTAATIAITAASYFGLTNQNETTSENEDDNTTQLVVNNQTNTSPDKSTSNNNISEDNNIAQEETSSQEKHTAENEENNVTLNNDKTTSHKPQPETESDNINTVKQHNSETTTTDNSLQNSDIENSIDQQFDDKKIIVPSAVIMSGTLEICPGESISFETLEQEDVVYAWSFGDNTYSNERAVSHTYDKSGKYAVSLIVTSTIDHSVLSKSKDMFVDVLPAPNTNFEVKNLTSEVIPSIQLISPEDLSSYYWDFGDGSHSTEKSPVKSFKRKGYYNITLSSQNHEGCKSSTTKKVTIKDDYNLLAPNSFTPNGDGINDFFVPEALKTMDVQFTMTIYSQNEGLIFETSNINQQWDGSNQQNGKNCTEGTYIWVVSLITSEGKSEQYKGAVLLLK